MIRVNHRTREFIRDNQTDIVNSIYMIWDNLCLMCGGTKVYIRYHIGDGNTLIDSCDIEEWLSGIHEF